MSNRHYWPTEPGRYLVEHENHAVHTWYLESDGEWTQNRMMGGLSVGQMERGGWLGVRTLFSEEADLKEFYKVFPKVTDPHDQYGIAQEEFRYEGWLAAKRDERGM